MRREAQAVDRCQLAWTLMSVVSGLWLLSQSGPVVQAVSSWARAVSPVMATLLSVGIILRVGSRPAQLFFHAARERMTAQNPPATNMQKLKLKTVFQFFNEICCCVGVHIYKMVLVMLFLLLLLYYQPLGSAQQSASTQLLHKLAANILLCMSSSCCKTAINRLLCQKRTISAYANKQPLLVQVEYHLFQALHSCNYCNYLQYVVLKELQVLTLLWMPQWVVGLPTLSLAHNCTPNLA